MMSPAFASWAAFFAMGGYAFYVWLAALATLGSLITLIVHTLWQRRRLLAGIRRQQARAQRLRRAGASNTTSTANGGASVTPARGDFQ